MELRHTPGPWTYCPDEDDIPGHRERARVEFGRSKWVNIGPHGNDYDARLIAAAPEMLSELANLLDCVQTYAPEFMHGIPTKEHVRNARAAIAKATGEASQ